MVTIRFTIGGRAFQSFNIYIDDNVVPAHQVGSSPGYQTVDVSVSPGTHKIQCLDPYFDINVSTIPASTSPTQADIGFRLLSTGDIQSKANGFWFDTTNGFISPIILKPSNSNGWLGFMTNDQQAVVYNTSGDVIAQSVEPLAYPQYLPVTNLWRYYNINTNTFDTTNAFPSTPPIISKSVTITGYDGQTLRGIMNLLEYSRFSNDNINNPPYIVNASGASFLSNIQDSTVPGNISDVTALNFVMNHDIVVSTPTPVPFTIFQPNQKPIDIVTTSPLQAASVVQAAVSSGVVITPESIAPIVINPIPSTLQQAPISHDLVQALSSIVNPVSQNNAKQFTLIAQNGATDNFVLSPSDYLSLIKLLTSGESVANVTDIMNNSPNNINDCMNFLDNNLKSVNPTPSSINTNIQQSPINTIMPSNIAAIIVSTDGSLIQRVLSPDDYAQLQSFSNKNALNSQATTDRPVDATYVDIVNWLNSHSAPAKFVGPPVKKPSNLLPIVILGGVGLVIAGIVLSERKK